MRKLYAALFGVWSILSMAQGAAAPAVKSPLLVMGQVKTAPAGMDNPNDVDVTSIDALPDASADEKARTIEGFAYANKVLASAAFKQQVLSMNIPGCFRKNAYEANFVYSNQAVYDLLVSKSPLKLNVIWYDGTGDNQGYEIEPTILKDTVGANRNAVQQTADSTEHPDETPNQKKAGFLATLLMHEASHVIGFQHPFCAFHQRDASIPYVMNQIYWDLAPQLSVPQQKK